jgi:hypothetical protein
LIFAADPRPRQSADTLNFLRAFFPTLTKIETAMNPQLRVGIILLWLVSVAGAYFAGSQFGPAPAIVTKSAPPPSAKPASNFAQHNRTPGSLSALESNAAKSSGTEASLLDGNGRNIPALIDSLSKTLSQGRDGMFGGLGFFRAFGPLLELSAEETQAALAEVNRTIEDPRQKRMIQSMLLGRMAETDPKRALAEVDKLIQASDDPSRSDGLYFSVVGALSSKDPEAAWKWYSTKRDSGTLPEEGARLSGMIFTGLAKRNLDQALSRFGALTDLDERNSAAAGIASAAKDPASWDRILKATASWQGSSGKEARAAMIRQWAGNDFQATTALLRSMPPAESQALIDSAGWGLMRSDPEKGAEFLMNGAPQEKVAERYNTIMNAWGERDPNAAGEWLNQQPPSPAQDGARANFARTVARRDPESALAWAKTVSDTGQRTNAIRDVYRQWSRRDPGAADAALGGSGLTAQQVEEIRKAGQEQPSFQDRGRGPFGPPRF